MTALIVGGVTSSAVMSAMPANADVGASAGFTVPNGASVGVTGLGGSITVSNTNTAPNQSESNSVSEIKFAPSCGLLGSVANPCPAPDPGVFSINPMATGAAATACAGQNFSVSNPDAAGAVTFAPTGSLVLAPPGGPGLSTCTINFTLNVLKVPSIDVSASPGTQTIANLRVKEVSLVSGLMPVVAVSQTITVNRGIVGMTTQASPGVAVGGSVGDFATLTNTQNAARPTGTVRFQLFGPNDASCSAASPPEQTSPVMASNIASVSGFVMTQPGVYRFVATYSGDANYIPRTSGCNDPGESLTVTGTAINRAVADFNGDGKTDFGVYRPDTGA